MSEGDPIVLRLRRTNRGGVGKGGVDKDVAGRASETHVVSFDRRELDLILRLYGLQVGAGEWRDYAIDMLKDKAVFSIFRHASEVPLYQIEKDPKLTRRQGAYSVVAQGGRVLKRGRDLEIVLGILKPKPRLAMV